MRGTVRERKKEEFFDICVRAFQSLTGDIREIYFCPLCGNGFTRKDLQQITLTLEHVPPKSLGGKELLLTCKHCNRTAGHKVDSALHGRQRHDKLTQALRDGSDRYQGRVRLKMGEENLNFDLHFDPRAGRWEFRPAGNDPQAMRRWESQMHRHVSEGTWDGLTVNVTTVHGFQEWLSRIGDLRIAYLLAFAAFGYRYAFDRRLDLVRYQLQNPEERKMTWFWKSLGWDKPQERVLAMAAEPVGLLYISLGKSIVFLPWLDGPVDPYKKLSSIFRKSERVSFTGTKIPWPDRPRLELDFVTKVRPPLNTQ